MKIKVNLILFEQCIPIRIEIPAEDINCIIEDIESDSSYVTDEERIYELRQEIYSMLGNEAEFDNLKLPKISHNKKWYKKAGTEKKKL